MDNALQIIRLHMREYAPSFGQFAWDYVARIYMHLSEVANAERLQRS